MPGNPWFGNSNNNAISVTLATYNATNPKPGPEVRGNGGDDLILRDRTGYYAQDGAGDWIDMEIKGGNDIDSVQYLASSSAGVSATLQSIFGYGFASMPSTGLGYDRIYDVENLGGTNFADTLVGSDENNVLWGFSGNDIVDGVDGNDTLYGQNGNDTMDGGTGSDRIDGGDGEDDLTGGSSNDTIDGGKHDDTIDGGSANDSLTGGHGNDLIEGGSGNDTIDGGVGNDTIDAGGNNDTVFDGEGSDDIDLGTGNDTLELDNEFGDNVIDGGTGTDSLVVTTNSSVEVHLLSGFIDRGVQGYDEISSIENVETFNGADRVIGNTSANNIKTGGGADTVSASNGDDTVSGGSGADVISGGFGNDSLKGDFHNDTIDGGSGDDTIDGGSQDDEMRGGSGADTMFSDGWADTFVYEDGDIGFDTIINFDVDDDTIFFAEGFLKEDAFGNVDLSEVLVSWNMGGGDSALAAHTENDGWEFIARLDNVSQAELAAQIDSGEMFHVEGQIDDFETLF